MLKTLVRGSRAGFHDDSAGGRGAIILLLAAAAMFVTEPLSAQAEAAQPAAETDDRPLKIGVISLEAVALQSPAGQRLQQELVAFQEDFAAGARARQEAARAIEQQVAEADSLSADRRRVLERQYQDALTEFQRFQQDKQEEATALRTEGLAQIQQEIAPVIEGIQMELGYDLVLNAQNTLIVIFSDRIDITQLVIDRLAASGS